MTATQLALAAAGFGLAYVAGFAHGWTAGRRVVRYMLGGRL